MDVENLKTTIKKTLTDPNTLTFVIAIISVIGIYFVYNYMIDRATSPVNVPYATELLTSRTKITTDKISTIKISGTYTTVNGDKLLMNMGMIIDNYVADGYQIPKYSFFYREVITDESKVNDTVFTNLKDNYTIFALPVDFHSTYGCSIMPGNYIDLYVKTVDSNDKYNNGSSEENKVVYQRFIKSIEVTKVVDKDGIDVFSYSDDKTDIQPKYMYFQVPIEQYVLLRKSQLISTDITIVPVPRNAGYSENPEKTEIVSDELQAFINAQTIMIPDGE